MKKILVMGLPGTGKTTFAQELRKQFQNNRKFVTWLNADNIREHFQDWDFSPEGRIRQAERMRYYADTMPSDYVIADFVAPTYQIREIFKADFTVWMNTEEKCQYEDTNQIFEKPELYHYNYVILDKNHINTAALAISKIV